MSMRYSLRWDDSKSLYPCPETSVTNYHLRYVHIPENRRSHIRILFDRYLLVNFNNILNSWNISEISFHTSENTHAVISPEPIKGASKASEKGLCKLQCFTQLLTYWIMRSRCV